MARSIVLMLLLSSLLWGLGCSQVQRCTVLDLISLTGLPQNSIQDAGICPEREDISFKPSDGPPPFIGFGNLNYSSVPYCIAMTVFVMENSGPLVHFFLEDDVGFIEINTDGVTFAIFGESAQFSVPFTSGWHKVQLCSNGTAQLNLTEDCGDTFFGSRPFTPQATPEGLQLSIFQSLGSGDTDFAGAVQQLYIVNCTSGVDVAAVRSGQCVALPSDCAQPRNDNLNAVFQSILTVQACNAEVTDTIFGTYSWPETAVGGMSVFLCELGSVLGSGELGSSEEAAVATRRCLQGGLWEDPNFSQCANTFDTLQGVEITPDNYEESISTLSDSITTAADNPADQNEDNIAIVRDVLIQTATLLADGQIVIVVNTVNNTVDILDNLQEWNPTVAATASADIVESIESIVDSYAVQENFTELVVEGNNLAFVVERVELQTLIENGRSFSLMDAGNGTLDANTGEDVGNLTELAPDEVASAFLPPSLFNMSESMNETGVFFSLYQTTVLFSLGGQAQIVSAGGAITMVGSQIIAATVAGQEEVRDLLDPVSILIRLRTAQNITNVTCVSYDFDAAGSRGNWTSEGCETEVIDDGDGVLDDEDIVICSCDHLTNFAVLVDVCSRTGGCEVSSEAQLALELISIIGVILSLFGTIATIITLLAFKKLRQRDPTKFHVQLCIAIFCMLLVFVIGIDRNEVSEVCVTVSVLIHYFTLVAVMWMGAEAVLMYQKLVKVFMEVTVRYMVILSLVCWLLPIIPAVIPAALDWHDVISFTDSGDIDFCFIGDTVVFFAAFLAPIFAVILFNFVIFFIVVFVLIRHTTKTSLRVKGEMMDMKTAIRLLVSITGVMFLFGLTWVFGALTIEDSDVSLTFQILFAVFNSLQGFFIFLFFVVLNKDAREAWKVCITCGRYTLRSSPSKRTHARQSKPTSSTANYSSKTFSLPRSDVPTAESEKYTELVNLEPGSPLGNSSTEKVFEDGIKEKEAGHG